MDHDISQYFTNSMHQQAVNSRSWRMTVLHMNFEDTQVTCFTMDAKVSVPDMIGASDGVDRDPRSAIRTAIHFSVDRIGSRSICQKPGMDRIGSTIFSPPDPILIF